MSLSTIADVVTLVGFLATIGVAWRAKTAADQARDAAQAVKNRLATLDTLADVSAAIATLSEIKTLQRLHSWDLVLDRYTILRRQLVRISRANLATTHATQVTGALVHFRIIEEKVERAREAQQHDRLDSADFNTIVARQIDELEGTMMAIKRAGA